MSTPEQLAKQMGLENVRRAGNQLGNYFACFVDKIHASERNDFFDPRNRDMWLTAFARFLEAQVNPDFPSND